MSLGDFIHNKLSEGNLPAAASLALTKKLPLILSPFLKIEDATSLSNSINDYLNTNDFSAAVSEAVGEPAADETEDEFVSRAKTAIEGILSKRFGEDG